jgi:hypothetical protein
MQNSFHAFFTTCSRQSTYDSKSCEVSVNIAQMSLRRLREAIQNNEVSFPSQVPTFLCQSRAEIQWRLVELYFVQNWSCSELGERYGVTMERARQILFNWVQRAIVLGYLQQIPPLPISLADPLALETAGFPAVPGMIFAPLSEPAVYAAGSSNGP